MNEFDALSLIVDTAIKHGKHNQKLHGRRFGPDTGDSAGGGVSGVDPYESGYQAGIASGMSSVDAADLGRRAAAAFAADPPKTVDKQQAVAALKANMNEPYSKDELEAITTYQNIYYEVMNDHLRGIPIEMGYQPEEIKLVISQIGTLSSAMLKNTVSENIEVYRGTTASKTSSLVAAVRQPGTVISDPGFMSTSTETDAADAFARISSAAKIGRVEIFFRVVVPAGQPAIFMPNAIKQSGESSPLEKEQEVLLPPKTNMIVRNSRSELIDRADGTNRFIGSVERIYVDVEVLP